VAPRTVFQFTVVPLEVVPEKVGAAGVPGGLGSVVTLIPLPVVEPWALTATTRYQYVVFTLSGPASA
jgi:hypothetical protein